MISEFRPGEPWPDTDGIPVNAHGGGFLHHEDVWYWYGEFKTAGTEGNVAQVGISCYSSRDLYNWKNCGIALPVSEEPGAPLERGCIMERPKVLFNEQTRKFVMWLHLERKGQGYSSAEVAVAVGDTPTGPFHFHRAFRPNGQMSRDMTLFKDEQGVAWQLRSSEENATLHIARLTEDYLDCGPDYVRAFEDGWLEAPAIIHHEGWYHLVGSYCTGWRPNACRHAVARSVEGPWKELINPCVGPHNGLTFHSQSTFLLNPPGSNQVIYVGDRWNPEDAVSGTYVWLPIRLSPDGAEMRWFDRWRLEQSPV